MRLLVPSILGLLGRGESEHFEPYVRPRRSLASEERPVALMERLQPLPEILHVEAAIVHRDREDLLRSPQEKAAAVAHFDDRGDLGQITFVEPIIRPDSIRSSRFVGPSDHDARVRTFSFQRTLRNADLSNNEIILPHNAAQKEAFLPRP